jgi:hypothetical protein
VSCCEPLNGGAAAADGALAAAVASLTADLSALVLQVGALNANFVAPAGELFSFSLQTNGVALVNTPWLNLPAVGDGAGIAAWSWGQQPNGQRVFHRWQQGGFARNAVGPGAAFPIAAQGGAIDTVTPSWNGGGGGVPPTWVMDAFVVNGNNLEIQLGSTDGLTVDWRVFAIVQLFGTAARLL